jgi:hypothetical protein
MNAIRRIHDVLLDPFKLNRVRRAARPPELDAALVHRPGYNIDVAEFSVMG